MRTVSNRNQQISIHQERLAITTNVLSLVAAVCFEAMLEIGGSEMHKKKLELLPGQARLCANKPTNPAHKLKLDFHMKKRFHLDFHDNRSNFFRS